MGGKAVGFGLLLVLFVFLLILEPLPVHAAATLVQQNNTGALGSTTPFTISLSFPSHVASGDVVAVGLEYDATLSSVLSVTDSLGSSYTQAVTASNTNLGATIYYATSSSSGADTVFAKFSLPCVCGIETVAIYIFEVSGVTTAGAATGNGSGQGTLISTSPVSFQSGAFLLGMIVADCGEDINCGYAAGSGFTVVSESNTQPFISAAEYATLGVSSPTSFPATIGGGIWAEVAVALNPAPTPPIPEYPLGLPILAILMIIGYGLIKRRILTRK